MALSHTRLADIQQIASSVASVYANPASKKTYIKGFMVYNSNTTTETVDIHCVPDASASLGSATAANRIFRLAVLADETAIIEFEFPIIMIDQNDAIFATTTTASKVNLVLFGDQE